MLLLILQLLLGLTLFTQHFHLNHNDSKNITTIIAESVKENCAITKTKKQKTPPPPKTKKKTKQKTKKKQQKKKQKTKNQKQTKPDSVFNYRYVLFCLHSRKRTGQRSMICVPQPFCPLLLILLNFLILIVIGNRPACRKHSS